MIHWAIVTDNEDPEKRGRIKFKSETLCNGAEFPDWVEPMFPYVSIGGFGWFFVPMPDTVIRIDADEDDFLDAPRARWLPTIYNDINELPEEFKEGYPFKMGITTPAGYFLFDTTSGEEAIKIADTNGNSMLLDKEGITAEDASKNKMKMDKDGITFELAGKIRLNKGESEAAILGNTFQTLFNKHIHGTGVGPSAPPTELLTGAELSKEVFVE